MTERFYSEYKRIFATVESHIVGFADESERELFTQALLNRMMFVHFISRKGWLTYDGNKDYLTAMWSDHWSQALQSNFYTTRLKPLFFSGLNNPQSSSLSGDGPALHAAIGDAPSLRGDLFEENELDRREDVHVPDEAIEPVITELFGRFDFTITESSPDNPSVAVDSELLGMVFEELVNERHRLSGSYTPGPVVSFMCREALKGFLSGERTGLSNEVIAELVDERRTRKISVEEARSVARALECVTVVDPACGSGAYLLGMMRELVGLRTALIDLGAETKSTYDLKLQIIRNNLYGADLDEFAVNLAKFLLWLSLVIEDEGDRPKSLPNLDFKIASGDSLLSRDPQENSAFLAQLARDSGIADLTAKFMEAWTRADRDRLRVEIAETQANIRSALDGTTLSDKAIDWQVEFAVIMGDGGFDIVISSPPHQRHQDIEDKPDLLHLYQDAVTARSDLYCYFYARGLQLLREGGMHVFACSSGWLDTDYGAKLRGHLLKTASIEAIYESAVDRQLSTTPTKTLISLIRKGVNDCGHGTRFIYLMAEFERAVSDANLRRERTLNRAQLVESGVDTDGRGRENYIGDKWGAKFLRAPDIYHCILNRYGSELVRLGDLADVKSGILTGAKNFFYLTEETINKWNIESAYAWLVMTSPMESRSIAVDQQFLPNQLFMCHDEISDLSGTGALDYIRWGEDQGYHLKPSVKSRPRWYDLGRKDLVHLAMGKLADKVARIYFSPSGLHFTDNFQVLTVRGNVSAISLCAALNSTLFQLMFFTEARANYSDGVRSIQTRDASNLLVVDPSLLRELDTELYASVDWGVLKPSAERREIDNAVFDALGMTTDERDGVYEGLSELTVMSLMT
ncbi:MAG: Eco57I restriction-modification methylase domain-containing protein [Chloroflexi bacterium]|nr:Eco57I restriction-modification methylase domain-containing protein [Chloroflexota bacterium]